MVQMIKQVSEEMRQAMREMSDFTIYTGCPDSDSSSVQQVVFEWVSKRNPDVQRYRPALRLLITSYNIFYCGAHSNYSYSDSGISK